MRDQKKTGMAGIGAIVKFKQGSEWECYRAFRKVEDAREFVRNLGWACEVKVLDQNGYVKEVR